jgi:hypothetical protein
MTYEEHVDAITSAVRAAVADGHEVYIDNDCCGCSRMAVRVSVSPESPIDDDSVIPLNGEA